MTKIRYNFSDGHNKDVKDKAPEWMETLFKNGFNKPEPVFINDLYASTVKVKKCSSCGKILASNEIGKCSSCAIIKN